MVRMLFFCNWGTWTHQKQQIHTADLVCYLRRCLIVNFFKHFPKMDSEMNCSISGLSPVKYCKQRVNRSSAVRVPCGSSLSWKNLFWPIKQFVPHIFYWNNESTSRRPLCSPQAQQSLSQTEMICRNFRNDYTPVIGNVQSESNTYKSINRTSRMSPTPAFCLSPKSLSSCNIQHINLASYLI